jgi:hypothetical protein
MMLNKGSCRWLLAVGLSLFAMGVGEPSDAQAQSSTPTPTPTRKDDAARRWRPPPGPNFSAISLALEGDDGSSLRTFKHQGQTFALGRFGERYAINIHNPLNVRVEVVVSVDGRDVVSGKKGDFVNNRGYVIAPHQTLTIDGFRTSLDEVAAFRFVDPGDSYSARLGTPENVGVIGVAVFAERVSRPEPVPLRAEPSKAKSPARPKSANRSKGDSASSASPQGLGTEFGEARASRVRQVTFERANPRAPSRIIALRYDDAQGLQARGIEVFDDVRHSEAREPQPFPDSRFASPPPPR